MYNVSLNEVQILGLCTQDYYGSSAPVLMGNEVHIAAINPYEYEINMTSVAKGTANWITA